jgi:hypothetical protein
MRLPALLLAAACPMGAAIAFWDAPLAAAGRITPGATYRDFTLDVSHWIRGSGPRQVRVSGCGMRPGLSWRVVVYGTSSVEGGIRCVAIRPAALLMNDLRVSEALRFTPSVTRGTFVVAGGAPQRQRRWRGAVVRLRSQRGTLQLNLDSHGGFEAFGLPPGAYAVTLAAPDVRQAGPLSITVPARGVVEQTFRAVPYGSSERVREALASARFYVQSLFDVLQETIAGK